MSETIPFGRRDFLKLVGIGVAGAASGCARPADKLIPYLVAPSDILPGSPYRLGHGAVLCVQQVDDFKRRRDVNRGGTRIPAFGEAGVEKVRRGHVARR